MTRAILFLLAALGLAACGTPAVKIICPPLVPYDAAFQQRAAAELDALPADAALVAMIGDYARLLAEIRACRKVD